jgi:hypothetical protein
VVQKWLDDFDKKLKAAGKRRLNLPQRAGAEPLYRSYRMGGVNLLPMSLVADVSQFVHGTRLLQSTTVGKLFNTILQTVVEKRIMAAAHLDDGNFANESTDVTMCGPALERRQAEYEIKSTWNGPWAPTSNHRYT